MEMLSVLFQYRSKDDPLPAKGPAVGLFADQEIRLVQGPLFEGEEVQAILSKPLPGTRQCQIQMVKRDGTEVLRGTASVGDAAAATALEARLTELKPLADPVILREVKVAHTSKRQTVRMAFDQNMGDL